MLKIRWGIWCRGGGLILEKATFPGETWTIVKHHRELSTNLGIDVELLIFFLKARGGRGVKMISRSQFSLLTFHPKDTFSVSYFSSSVEIRRDWIINFLSWWTWGGGEMILKLSSFYLPRLFLKTLLSISILFIFDSNSTVRPRELFSECTELRRSKDPKDPRGGRGWWFYYFKSWKTSHAWSGPFHYAEFKKFYSGVESGSGDGVWGGWKGYKGGWKLNDKLLTTVGILWLVTGWKSTSSKRPRRRRALSVNLIL